MYQFKDCVGCGYCCLQAPCFFAVLHFDLNPGERCYGLKWSEKDKRYWCLAADRIHTIGLGCPSTLTGWRENVIERG